MQAPLGDNPNWRPGLATCYARGVVHCKRLTILPPCTARLIDSITNTVYKELNISIIGKGEWWKGESVQPGFLRRREKRAVRIHRFQARRGTTEVNLERDRPGPSPTSRSQKEIPIVPEPGPEKMIESEGQDRGGREV